MIRKSKSSRLSHNLDERVQTVTESGPGDVLGALLSTEKCLINYPTFKYTIRTFMQP